MKRYLTLLFFAAGLATLPFPGAAQEALRVDRVEVVEVSGIVDGSVERAVLSTIEEAEDQGSTLVVVQISSPGVIDVARTERMVEAIGAAQVPVVTWVGPPGAAVAHGAVPIVAAGHLSSAAPGSTLGPVRTLDLRSTQTPIAFMDEGVLEDRLGAEAAQDAGLIDLVEFTVRDLLTELDGRELTLAGVPQTLSVDVDRAAVRFHNLDLLGRILHAAAQPSIAYLLLLLGLVGLVFEVFHPSTGPAGIAGLAGLALGIFGVATLGGSWLGVVLIVLGVAAFCVDLRFSSLGPFTLGGLLALIAGSLILFPSPWLSISPWVLAIGIVGMVLFLLGAMTRVLRDLRAIARGELEVRDPHPHPDGDAH